jgi:hypothetical protein
MKVMLTPAKPEVVTKFNLECGGKVIGRIELSDRGDGSRCHHRTVAAR